MSKIKKGRKENPVTDADLAQLNEKPYIILEAAIKDGLCNYKYEITKGLGFGDKHGVDGKGIVLHTMYTAFSNLNVHLACIDDAFKMSGVDIEDIELYHGHDITGLYQVNAIKIKGSKNDESVILIGTKHVSSAGGHFELQSPKIPLDGFSSYKWYNELKQAVDQVRHEVELYKEGNYEVAEVEEKPSKKLKQLSILSNVVSGDGNDTDPDFENDLEEGKV